MKNKRVATSGLAMLLAVAAPPPIVRAQEVTITSDYCRNAYGTLSKKPAKRAMALSRDGKICHSAWGEASQAQADRKALEGCQQGNTRKCAIVRR